MSTKAEKAWFRAVQDMGCIVCLRNGFPGTPCEIHHVHRNGRRVDHFHSIGLCVTHHRNGNRDHVARHPTKARFEAAYGTEWELLEITQALAKVRAR